jgi:hypothetical protein
MTPPILVTTVVISPTAHSRVERGGVISIITTMVESSAPPAATSPAALNAAAPANPPPVGSGMPHLQARKDRQEAASAGDNRRVISG